MSDVDEQPRASREFLTQAKSLADGWYRGGGEITLRDGLSAIVLGSSFAAVALAIAAGSGVIKGTDLVVLVVLVGLYVVAYHTEFESSMASVVPTEPILVGMLFLLPREIVPLTVLVALVLAPGGGDREPGPLWRTLVVRALSGWHCIGPVAVLWSRGEATISDWPLYLAALGAQFAIEIVVTTLRSGWALRAPWREVAAALGWAFATDLLLAPIGLAAVIATEGHRVAGFVLLACPVLLMRLLSLDRRVQVNRSLELGEAVVEATVQARTDALTRVGNRRAWQEALEQAERFVAGGSGRCATMALLDLDDLKLTNDTLGHAAGDRLIAAAGELLLAAAPDGATVARIGGDEFAVLIVGPDGEVAQPDALAESIRRALATHPSVGGATLRASVGSASCPPAPTVGIAAQWADAGIYAEKATRRQA